MHDLIMRHLALPLSKSPDTLVALHVSTALQVTSAWMSDGLKQRCITRDLKWGIPAHPPAHMHTLCTTVSLSCSLTLCCIPYS
jgi:hypothetical protein